MWKIQLLLVVMCRGLSLDSRNVGTTLFEPADLTKKCWGHDTVSLLNDRMAADDLLPDGETVPRVTSKYVLSLTEYIFLVLETVRRSVSGYRLHSMSLASADVFGGFIYSVVLPRARMEYYAGNLPCDDVRTLYDILSAFQTLLRTNYRFWKPPDNATEYPSADPIQISSKSSNECSKLITFPRNDSDSFVIPLPFVDNKFEPTTVAVPFKKGSLYNLQAPYSAMIVAKYYVTSMKCLQERSCQQDEINGFCEYFYVWLVEDVVPLLRDEPWYEAFGGVLRILESMKQMGIANFEGGKFVLPEHKTKYNKPGSINIDYYNPTRPPPPPPPPPPLHPPYSYETSMAAGNASSTFSQNTFSQNQPGQSSDDNGGFSLFGQRVTREVLVIASVAVATAATMWMLTLLLLLCCRCTRCCRCASGNGGGGCAFYNVFVSFFYMIKDSLNPNSSIKKADGEDVEQQRFYPQKESYSPASSAGKLARASSSSSSVVAAPVLNRPLAGFHGDLLETHEEGDESLSETTTDTEDDYFHGSKLRKVTSS